MPEELKKRRREYMKAHPLNYWLGKKRTNFVLSEKGRLAIIRGLKNRRISEKVIANTAQLNKGKFGKAHPKWTENKKRPFYKAIRTLVQYKKWRMDIFIRDDFACILCNARGYVEADHYPKQFIDIVRGNMIETIDQAINCKELWNAEGRTLCKKCHLSNRLSKKGREKNSKKFFPAKAE